MKYIEIYTDGSSINKEKIAGWSTCVMLPDGKRIIYYGHLSPGTNNTGELYGIVVGLAIAKRLHGRVRINTDSEYSKGVLFDGNQAISNKEIVSIGKRMRNRFRSGTHPVCRWVKGHSGVEGNELADKYAKYGRDQQKMRSPDSETQILYMGSELRLRKFLEEALRWECVM